MSFLIQMWLRRLGPSWRAFVTRIIYTASNMKFMPGLSVDGVPRILLDPTARIEIGRNVQLRRDVELRAHGNASITIADDVRIDRGVRILAANNAHVHIGCGCRIGLHSVFNGGDDITLGADVLVSGFVYLQTSQHRFDTQGVAIRNQGYDHAPIICEDGAWLAAHVVVMPGVKIGERSVVGSNAVVTHSVDKETVVGGVPAQKLSNIGCSNG